VIKVNNFNTIAKDSLDEWIYFLKTEQIENDFKAKGLQEAKEKLDYMKADETEQKRYENFKRELHDKASEWEGTYIVGEMEGMKKGKREEKLEIAKVSLSQGLEIEMIAKITGLSVEEIESLKG